MQLIYKSKLFYQLTSFVAVGLINTALSFLLLNLISKFLNVESGWLLGFSSAIGFLAAVVQSYFWNKAWTFLETERSWRDLMKSAAVGFLGAAALAGVLLASKVGLGYQIYAVLLVVFLIFEFYLWVSFQLSVHKSEDEKSFLKYFFVSLVGLLVNFVLVSVISSQLHVLGGDLDKNLAGVLATLVSLAWNFLGYKLFVF